MSLDLAHEFTLNPDGSGKATVRWAGPLDERSPAAAEFLTSEFELAQGVEAWRDVACGPESGSGADQIVFRATAYFRDVAALHFHCQGFRLHALDWTLVRAADDSVVVATRIENRTPSASIAPNATDAELRALMPEERSKLGQARGGLVRVFAGLRCGVVLRLPGEVAEAVGCERIAANALRVEIRGSDLVAIVDRLLHDDALMLRVMRQGGASPETVSALIGDGGPIRARTRTGACALFDYEVELAAARAAFTPERGRRPHGTCGAPPCPAAS